MLQIDPRIDAYIAKSEPFARPILSHIRKIVHQACPDVQETMKWSMPFFDYKGEMMCNMAGFKNHCSFGFWKASLMNDPKNILTHGKTGMGDTGKLSSISNLPPEEDLFALIFEAMRLNDEGIKLPSKSKPAKTEIIVPDYFLKILKENPDAEKAFFNFSYSHKKEYVNWIEGAKREETRQNRLTKAIEYLSEGKGKDWRYER
jgi:uncharacterized protein YdeI (YjbR/CyaY-like superfamily)